MPAPRDAPSSDDLPPPMPPEAAAELLASSPAALVQLDPAGRVRWANPAATALLGTAATATGAPLAATLGLEQPLAGGEPCQARGSGRWLRTRVAALADGSHLATFEDAGPWVQAQAELTRLGELLDVAREFGRLGLWQRDARSQAGCWDRQVLAIWGLDSGAGTPSLDDAMRAIVPEDREALRAAYTRSLRAAGRYAHRYRVRRPDGTERQVHSQWRVKLGADGLAEAVIGVVMDDTEAWQLAQANQEREAALALAEELAGVARWRLDLRTNHLQYNDQAHALIDLPPSAQGLSLEALRALIHPTDLPRFQATAEATLRTGLTTDVEARFRRADGSWRTIMTRRVLQRDPQGEPIAFVGVAIDVTARVEAARRARVLAQRFEFAARAAGIGYWSLDEPDTRVTWDRTMRQLHGVSADDPAPTLSEWISRFVHPADRLRVLHNYRIWRREGSLPFSAEYRIVRTDGEVRELMTSAHSEQRDDAETVYGIVIDITERRRTDLALRQAHERGALAARGVGMGTWGRDLHSGETYWDEAMWRLRGRARRDTPPSPAEMLAMVHPDDRAGAEQQMIAASSGAEVVQSSFRIVRPDGEVRWLESRSSAVRDAAGEPVHRIGVNWDVTDARVAEAERRERELVERASQAKSQFLARMSHELRTPLNAVFGFTQLMLADSAGAHPADMLRRERAQHVLSAARHLLSLINDVLDLSQLQTGQLHMAAVPIPLAPLVADTLPLLEPLVRAQGLEPIRLGPLHGLPLADPTRLRQVLINLLSNALKYNRPGGSVTLSARVDGDDVAIQVADTGRGMSAAQMAQLYEPFNRLGLDVEPIAGSGIGLAISKGLVEQMKGRLSASSASGVGSSFVITLPGAEPVPSRPGAGPEAVAAPAIVLDGSSRAGTVLCIEDNPVNMLLVAEVLGQRSQLVLLQAANGEDGVRAAREHLPDLILLDMQLPDIDGLEVFRRLRADPRTASLRCVALSANAMPEQLQRARDAGLQDYWTKPIDLGDFLRRIDAHFQAPADA